MRRLALVGAMLAAVVWLLAGPQTVQAGACADKTYTFGPQFTKLHSSTAQAQKHFSGVTVDVPPVGATSTVVSVTYSAYDGYTAPYDRPAQGQTNERFFLSIGDVVVPELSADVPDAVPPAPSTNYSGVISGTLAAWQGVVVYGGELVFNHASLLGVDPTNPNSFTVSLVQVTVQTCGTDGGPPTTTVTPGTSTTVVATTTTTTAPPSPTTTTTISGGGDGGGDNPISADTAAIVAALGGLGFVGFQVKRIADKYAPSEP